MKCWIYQPPYSLLDLVGALIVVVGARLLLPPIFVYSFLLHPETPNIGWLEIVEIAVVLLVMVFVVSKIVEPLRKMLSRNAK